MPTTPALLPGSSVSEAGPEANWTGAGNALTDNQSYATIQALTETDTDFLLLTDYGFALPAGDQIDGVQVWIESKCSLSNRCSLPDIQLRFGGVKVGTSKSSAFLSTTEGFVGYGSETDDWGAGLSGAQVNDPSFGVAIQGRVSTGSPSATLSIDVVQIMLTHSTPPFNIRTLAYHHRQRN